MKRELLDALYKRAVGHYAEETVTEYGADDVSLKKKVTNKYYPPDIAAIKLYDEVVKADNPYAEYSDKELEKEKKRLLKELKRGGKNESR